MNTRPLSPAEDDKLTQIRQVGLDCQLLYLTSTGLNKMILDATKPLRALLASKGVHDYDNQGQGQGAKVTRSSTFLSGTSTEPVQVSLYRPETGNGDPRIWFTGLNELAKPDDILVLFVHDDTIHFLNLTQLSLEEAGQANVAKQFIESIQDQPGSMPGEFGDVVEFKGRLREVPMTKNNFLVKLLDLQQDGKDAISAPSNWKDPLLLNVDTEVDEIVNKLAKSILWEDKDAEARWHFFLGSPGNGKSAAIGKLCNKLANEHSCEIEDNNEPHHPISFKPQTTENDDHFMEPPYALRICKKGEPYASAVIIQDASAVKNPFEKEVDPAKDLAEAIEGAWNQGISLVVCANRGILEKAVREGERNECTSKKQWFRVMSALVHKTTNQLDGELQGKYPLPDLENRPSKATVTYSFLDNHSLLLGNDKIFHKLIDKAIDDENWAACTNCENSILCPFKANKDWLDNTEAKENFLKVLQRAEVLSGQIVVFREALAIISLILAGCPKDYAKDSQHPCDWVHDKAEQKDIFSLAMRRIYMSMYASFSQHGLEVDKGLRGEQKKDLLLLYEDYKKDADKNTGKQNSAMPQAITHLQLVVKDASPPSTDVGITRLTGSRKVLAEIDPWCDPLSSKFIDRWDGDLLQTLKTENEQFTEIERRCTETWIQLEQYLENFHSPRAPETYAALRRWSSNFLVHFGALREAENCWGDELDEFIEMQGLKKDEWGSQAAFTRRTSVETKLHEATSIKDKNEGHDLIPLSESVKLTGNWANDKLRPKISGDEDKRPANLSIPIELSAETVALSARAFIWLVRQVDKGLESMCIPHELLNGVRDARVRAAASGKTPYAIVDDSVKLVVNGAKDGETFELTRSNGWVYVEEKND